MVHTALIANTFVEIVSMKAIALILMEHALLDAMLVMRGTCVKNVSRQSYGLKVKFAASY